MSCTSTFAAETAQGNEKLVVPRPKGLLHLELCSCLLWAEFRAESSGATPSRMPYEAERPHRKL